MVDRVVDWKEGRRRWDHSDGAEVPAGSPSSQCVTWGKLWVCLLTGEMRVVMPMLLGRRAFPPASELGLLLGPVQRWHLILLTVC